MSFYLETVDGRKVEPFGFCAGIDSEVQLASLPVMHPVQFASFSVEALIDVKKYLTEQELGTVKEEVLSEMDYRDRRALSIRPYFASFTLGGMPNLYPDNPFVPGEEGIIIGQKYEVSVEQFAEFTLRMLGRLNSYNPLEFNQGLERLKDEFV